MNHCSIGAECLSFTYLTSGPASVSLTDRVAQTADRGLHGHSGRLTGELRYRRALPRLAGGLITDGHLVATEYVLLAATKASR